MVGLEQPNAGMRLRSSFLGCYFLRLVGAWLLGGGLVGCQALVPLPDRFGDGDLDFERGQRGFGAQPAVVDVEPSDETKPTLVVHNGSDDAILVLLDGEELGSVAADTAESFAISSGFHELVTRASGERARETARDHFTVEAGYRYRLRLP